MPGFEVFGTEERQAINDLLDANGGILFAHGFDGLRNGIYRVREFEKAASEKFNIKYVQAVSSGTAALRVALAALEIGPGDEVIIPAFTFVATAEAVIACGARPIIVDIDDSFNMDPNSLLEAISSKTKAIMPVHMMGAPADMKAIMQVAKDHNVHVIEDAAQGVGGSFGGKPLGTIGDIGCYSYDAGKTIITGEGGMVVTNNQKYFEKSRAYHDHGHEYSTTVGRGSEGAIGEGFNFRMTEIHAAIGIVQLTKLEKILHEQRKNKKLLWSKLKDGKFPFKFRRVIDWDGDIGDSIIFTLPNSKMASKFVKGMGEENLGTKNVPDAIRWHFAKHWSHMFNKYGWYKDNYRLEWEKSAKILESSVAIPVMVKMSEKRIFEIADKLLKIGRSM